MLPPMGTLSCWAAAVIFAPVTTGFRCPAFQVDILRVIGNRRRAEGRSRPLGPSRAQSLENAETLSGDIFSCPAPSRDSPLSDCRSATQPFENSKIA